MTIPIGHVNATFSQADTSYAAIKMSVSATGNHSNSDLLHLSTSGNTNANVVVNFYGGVEITSNVGNTINLWYVQNNCENIIVGTGNSVQKFVDTEFNETLHNQSYSESFSYIHSSNGWITINPSESNYFIVTSENNTINNMIIVEPTKLDRAYNFAIQFNGIGEITSGTWTTSNVLWPSGQYPTTTANESLVLSFLGTKNSTDSTYNNEWYGFNPFSRIGGIGGSSATRTCIAVIDEALGGQSGDPDNIRNDWLEFRSKWPNRPFYIMWPNPNIDDDPVFLLRIPTEYINDPLAYYPIRVNRDIGVIGQESDWFTLAGLGALPYGSKIALFIDESGSMTRSTVEASLNLFRTRLQERGMDYIEVFEDDERWSRPFINISEEAESSGPSFINDKNIRVVYLLSDYYSVDAGLREKAYVSMEFDRYRLRYPQRKIHALYPEDGAVPFLPSNWSSYPNIAFSSQINVDGVSGTSDWFDICGFDNLPSGCWIAVIDRRDAFQALFRDFYPGERTDLASSWLLFRQKCAEKNIGIIWTSVGLGNQISNPTWISMAYKQYLNDDRTPINFGIGYNWVIYPGEGL